MEQRLTRVEIAIEAGTVKGAQMTVEEGVIDSDAFIRIRERTVGLNVGNCPEYETALYGVLDEALTLALVTVDSQARRIAELEAASEEATTS